MSIQIRRELDHILSEECVNGELYIQKCNIILLAALLIGLFLFLGTYIWTFNIPQMIKSIASILFVVILIILFILVFRNISGLKI